MGVFKRLSDVPERYRFRQYKREFKDRDVWQEYEAEHLDRFGSNEYRRTFRKVSRTWKSHMDKRKRHHALAKPSDVDSWCEKLAEGRLLETVYHEYWVRIEEFYSWLQFHVDYPHLYNPALMAASRHDTAMAIWAMKYSRKGGIAGDGQ